MKLRKTERYELPNGIHSVYESKEDAAGYELHVFYPFLNGVNTSSVVKKYALGVEIDEFPWEKEQV